MTGLIILLTSLAISFTPVPGESYRAYDEIPKPDSILFKKEKQKSYRAITRQINTRLYEDLNDLKDIRH